MEISRKLLSKLINGTINYIEKNIVNFIDGFGLSFKCRITTLPKISNMICINNKNSTLRSFKIEFIRYRSDDKNDGYDKMITYSIYCLNNKYFLQK